MKGLEFPVQDFGVAGLGFSFRELRSLIMALRFRVFLVGGDAFSGIGRLGLDRLLGQRLDPKTVLSSVLRSQPPILNI